jgi:hypothetical protein
VTAKIIGFHAMHLALVAPLVVIGFRPCVAQTVGEVLAMNAILAPHNLNGVLALLAVDKVKRGSAHGADAAIGYDANPFERAMVAIVLRRGATFQCLYNCIGGDLLDVSLIGIVRGSSLLFLSASASSLLKNHHAPSSA